MEMGRAASFALPRSTNGDIRDGTDFPPSGSYTVDPDCTGSKFEENGNRSNNVVVLDGGKRFFLLSVAPDTITTEEGRGSSWRTKFLSEIFEAQGSQAGDRNAR